MRAMLPCQEWRARKKCSSQKTASRPQNTAGLGGERKKKGGGEAKIALIFVVHTWQYTGYSYSPHSVILTDSEEAGPFHGNVYFSSLSEKHHLLWVVGRFSPLEISFRSTNEKCHI